MTFFRTLRPDRAFRTILAVDAVATAATGLLLVGGATVLEPWLGLSPSLLRTTGWSFVLFGGLVGWAARRETTPAAALLAIVAYNALYVLESLGAAALGLVAPTTLGLAALLGLAAIVAAFTALEAAGLRRSRAPMVA